MSELDTEKPDVGGVVGKDCLSGDTGGTSTTACNFVWRSFALSADRLRSIILDWGGELRVGTARRGAIVGRVGLIGGVGVVKLLVR